MKLFMAFYQKITDNDHLHILTDYSKFWMDLVNIHCVVRHLRIGSFSQRGLSARYESNYQNRLWNFETFRLGSRSLLDRFCLP